MVYCAGAAINSPFPIILLQEGVRSPAVRKPRPHLQKLPARIPGIHLHKRSHILVPRFTVGCTCYLAIMHAHTLACMSEVCKACLNVKSHIS